MNNGGLITLEIYYEAKERNQLVDYRGYEIVSMALFKWRLVLLQIMSILENFDLEIHRPNSAETIHLLSESMQRAMLISPYGDQIITSTY